MKPIIMDLNDISDSTEVYDSKPHPFLIWFIGLLLAILVTAFLWAYFFHIDIVIKASGVVNTKSNIEEKISLISGTVKNCAVKDNDFVKQGDLLYEVNDEEVNNQINEYENSLNIANARLDILDAYLKAIDGDKSSLDSMKDNIYFDEFNTKYKLYKNKRSSLEEKQKSKDNEANLMIDSSTNMSTEKTNDNSKEIELAFEELLLSEKGSIYTEKNTNEVTKSDLEEKISKLKESVDKYKVYADKDGYINFKQDINKTNYISAGTAVYEIIPDNTDENEVDIYVGSEDIGKIEEGMEIKYDFSAYPSDEYGSIKGKVFSISNVSKAADESGNVYYLVKASIDEEIKNSKGEKAQLKKDMTCNSKIVVDNQSIMKYMLKKINILK